MWWRAISGAAFVLASMAFAMSVVLFALNDARVNDIQQSRRDAVMAACIEQNARHDHAVQGFLTNPAFRPHTKLTPEQERKRVITTRAFVQLIVPQHNCQARVRAIK